MSLTVHLKNIGILKQAEFSLGDLTIICGDNNTGKTYAACALYGFLESWRNFIRFPISNAQIQQALIEPIKIDLAQATKNMLAEACKKYTEQLDKIFAAPESTFQNSEFRLVTDEIDIRGKQFSSRLTSLQNPAFIFAKGKGSEEVILTSQIREEHEREIDTDSVKSAIDFVILNDIFSDSLPRTFISSAERTGAAVFRKELNFARDRLLKEMAQADKNMDPRELLFKAYQSYPEPVEHDMNFMYANLKMLLKERVLSLKNILKSWKILQTSSGANTSLHKTTNSTISPKARGTN